jgi:exo-1,4-beta-D-glucosaminidase
MGKADWDFHCGRHAFSSLDRWMEAFRARYGDCGSAAEFAFKAQASNFEAMRAMFEAFGIRRDRAHGVIQWMLNASWPKLYWQLYDHGLAPNGAYYGAQRACSPLSVAYDYGTKSVHVVNGTTGALEGAVVTATAYDLDSREILRRTARVTCPAGASVKAFDLGDLPGTSPVRFLDLALGAGKDATANFYWLSAKPDVLDDSRSTWFQTPNASYADFRTLGALPPAKVQVRTAFRKDSATVTLTNPTDRLAFFLELGLAPEGGDPLPTALWDANYVSLPPRATRTLHVSFRPSDLKGRRPRVTLQGWNVPPIP